MNQGPVDGRPEEDAEEVLAVSALQDEERAEGDHDPADDPARGVHDQQDHDDADAEVDGIGNPATVYEGERIPADVGLHPDGKRDAQHVVG